MRVVGVKTVQHQFAVPVDDGQEVVEIVRHSPRQPSHRLHLLRLAEAVPPELALGHILFGGDEVGDFAARIPDRGDVHFFGVKASRLFVG